MHVRNSESVIGRAAQVFGDLEKAQLWYFDVPLPEFDGQTAELAVANGREVAVLKLLDIYDAGPLG